MMKVTTPNLADAKRCRVRITIDQVGNIWTLLIFHALADGSLRFMEIKRAFCIVGSFRPFAGAPILRPWHPDSGVLFSGSSLASLNHAAERVPLIRDHEPTQWTRNGGK
jgi:hypothetical protein